ncbi:hypothetical protein K443DRAFT_679969 [Laccaria amethystina LaAM-08-1]|uniref:Mug135-like C-terminal domain-containing protein n=1 Tax=Laccaria amethystina LaAM-08-1 TaxID=1095629 RepID=A0A0C9WNT4_9AGAR|nr:hypothetical protein K443DRAFT_679969 [Laccaria amethystina LaAM-08-1]
MSISSPQAVDPPWIQPIQAGIQQILGAIQQLHAGIVPDLKRLMNQHRADGAVIEYEIVPFTNGDDPTQPPHNLPYLGSVNAIENLDGNELVGYLNGYGVVPPAGTNPVATNLLQVQTLKRLVGVLGVT